MQAPLAPPPPAPPEQGRRDGPPTRRIGLRTLFNVRDLGGYATADGRRVRWGRVFRADGLHRVAAHPGDAARVTALGLRTVVDLRTIAEVERTGGYTSADLELDWWHHPVLSRTWDEDRLEPGDDPVAFLAARSLEMIESGGGAIASVVALLSGDESLPLAFHCAVGKDRTGVVAAVVLALLGVPDEVIAHDYGLSRGAMTELGLWLEEVDPEAAAALASLPAAYRDAPPAAMRRFLAQWRRTYGSPDAWADRWCVDGAALARLRANLLV